MTAWNRLSLGARPVNHTARTVSGKHHKDDDPPIKTVKGIERELLIAKQELAMLHVEYDELLRRYGIAVQMFSKVLGDVIPKLKPNAQVKRSGEAASA